VELPASQVSQRCIRCSGRVVRIQVAAYRTVQIALAICRMSLGDLAHVPVPVRRLSEPPVLRRYAGFVM
jgi:hypothetical protein